MIEPKHDFGYSFLEIILEIIQESRRQELAESFTYRPADLRLPGKLYVLRLTDEVDSAKLDRIALLLASGETAKAKSALDLLAKSTPENGSSSLFSQPEGTRLSVARQFVDPNATRSIIATHLTY